MGNSTHSMSEILVQYLDGELTGTEKERIAHLISSDTMIRREYESLLATREAIRLSGLQKRVGTIHSEMMKELAAPVKSIHANKKPFRYAMIAAASIIVLIGATLAYNYFSITPGKVFSLNYRSYQLTTMRDQNSGEQSNIEKLYRTGNYGGVVKQSDIGGTILSQKDIFLRAISFMELADYEHAREQFLKISQPDLLPQTEFYLALDYIQLKDYEHALTLLTSIHANPNHIYHEEVTTRLLRQVRILKKRS
jgi:hypothetical protein